MTINTNEDFRSQFNSDWASKLIIGVDEVLLDKKEDSERIKNLSTSKHFKSEAKGIDKLEINFFGKFILCSNNEETFIKIDPEEIRYWVRKIPVLTEDNIHLLDVLKAEIPFFLNYLKEREFSTNSNSRMWFTSQQIQTEALLRVKQGNRTLMEKEIKEIILEEIYKYQIDEICFTIQDLFDLVKPSLRITQSQISELLRRKWGLTPNETPSTYKRHYFDHSQGKEAFPNYETKKGRYFVFKKEKFAKM